MYISSSKARPETRCPHGFDRTRQPQEVAACLANCDTEISQSNDPHGRAAELSRCHPVWYDGLTTAIESGTQGDGVSELRSHLLQTLAAHKLYPKEALATVFEFFGVFERYTPEQRQFLSSIASCLSRGMSLGSSLVTAGVEKTRSKRNSSEVEDGSEGSAMKRSKAEA